MVLLPAIDLVNGKATRLTEGKAGTEKVYGEPAQVAQVGAVGPHGVGAEAALGGE